MKKVYNYLEEPDCAYFLKEGTVYFEVKEGEVYKISGKNLIVAAGEVLLNYNSDNYFYRAYSLYKDDNTELAAISPDNLQKFALKYSVGYNMNVFFAQMIKITNKILAKRQSALTDDSKIIQKLSNSYFEITNLLMDLAKKTKFPDIVQLSEKLRSELIYETGKIFSQQKSSTNINVEKEKLNEFNISFGPDSIICSEGETGNEMYILNKGRIGVFINDNQVAEINQPGTVIGEIALLLGETRTATLKAIDQVVLSIIKKDTLAGFHKNHERCFLEIGETFAKRINNNFQIINKIDQQTKEKSPEKVAGFLNRDRTEKHLVQLDRAINDLYKKKSYEQLPAIIEKVEKIRQTYSI